jgi:predicted Zn-dependent peptidase
VHAPRKTVLPNGLTVVTIELPHLHRATVVVYARVGSRYESEATSGLSHFTEHMLFRGTRRHPDAFELSDAIERAGGTLYAETGIDYSLYQLSLHPDRVADAVALLGEVFAEPRFADLEVERRIVLEEILETLDAHGRETNVDTLARRALFPAHPMGYAITGSPRNVRGFRLGDVRRHFARFYGAENLVLCVSGAIRHREAIGWARRAFSKVPRGLRAGTTTPPDGQREPKWTYVRSPGSQTVVQVLLRGLPEDHPDWTALVLLSRTLDDGLSARLHHRICDELGLAYHVSASLEPFVDTGLFELNAQAAHENALPLLREMFDIIRSFRTRPVPALELEKVKDRYRWDLEASFDDPDAMAGWFGGGELFAPVPTFEQKIRDASAVTPKDLMRVAQNVLRPDRTAVACVGDLDPRTRRRVQRLVREHR